MIKRLLFKSLVVLVPTYAVAAATEKMVYTMPMLAVTLMIASSLREKSAEVPHRVEGQVEPSESGVESVDG